MIQDQHNHQPSIKSCGATALRAFLPARGSREVGRKRLIAVLFAVSAAAVASLLVSVTSVPAASPPQAKIQIVQSRPLSTRLDVQPEVSAEGSTTEWALQIATSATGPWTTLANGTIGPTIVNGGAGNVYHHLKPETRYYLRIVATNASGTTIQTQIYSDYISFNQYPEYFNADWLTTNRVVPPEVGPLSCAHTATSFECSDEDVESNGAQTTYHFEYSLPEGGQAPAENSPSWHLFTSAAEGTISVAEDFARLEHARAEGLDPETIYYVRARAANEKGQDSSVKRVETARAKPWTYPSPIEVESVTGTYAHLFALLNPANSETKYRFEYTKEPKNAASWTEVPGSAGTIGAALATEVERHITGELTGLDPGAIYYVRLFAENQAGEGEICSGPFGEEICEPMSTAVYGIAGFETAGPPAASTFPVHSLHGEAMRALGAINPNGRSTDEEQAVTIGGGAGDGTFTLSFDGETTGPIPFTPGSEEEPVKNALESLSGIGAGNIQVEENIATSTYTVRFVGALGGKDQPQLTVDPSGLTPSGTATVTTVIDGAPFQASYHVEYVSDEQFAHGAWTEAQSTTPVPLGPAGHATKQVNGQAVKSYAGSLVGEDLPGLQAGKTYHYRIAAASGVGAVTSDEQTLTVPAAAAPESEESCDNALFRTGLSAGLPDCRAYEQVTPVDKRGAMDFTRYGPAQSDGAIPGLDGEHLLVHAPGVAWGSSPASSEPNYVFGRTAAGWDMTSLAPQPEAGLDRYLPEIFNPDLTQVGLVVGWQATQTSESAKVEPMVGPSGGPYTALGSIPRSATRTGVGTGVFAAGAADGSKYVLQTADHVLLGHSTGTASGEDLYEFSGGQLRQANVLTGGSRISTCGARIARGSAEGKEGQVSSPHAVSADGSRVFFTDNCTHHLYMRVNGSETIDVGEYGFLAADASGSELLLEKVTGESHEYLLYEAGPTSKRALFTVPGESATLHISADFTTIEVRTADQLTAGAPSNFTDVYEFDIPAHALRFLLAEPKQGDAKAFFGFPEGQAVRYDRAERLVQCVSCASRSDPEPKLAAVAAAPNWYGGSWGGGSGGTEIQSFYTENGVPERTFASADGDYVFFDTPAALLPADVNGEIAPEATTGGEHKSAEYVSLSYSPSSDVYEWRRYGVHGCTAVQGCLALITSGTAGLKNILLGTDPSGRDVFFATHQELLSSDDDAAGDVYDARIGGGFPAPVAPPVECEGDACESPLAAPIDTTPASLAFSGPGNLLTPAANTPVVTAPRPQSKPKACKKGMVRKRMRCVRVKRRSTRTVRRQVKGRRK